MNTGPLIIGVGNPLRGDDGVGPRVVASLRGRVADERLAVSRGDAAELMALWEGRGRVVVVDAARAGGPPGSLIERDLSAEDPPTAGATSTHGFGLAEAVALGRALGQLPASLHFIGIEAAAFGPGEGLSPAVAAAAIAVADRLASYEDHAHA